MARIEVTGIKKTFGDLPTLDGITLSVSDGEFVSLVGPSGCGKSSLFNVISGLASPDCGQVTIDGEDYTGRTGRVSYMYQKDLLLPWRSVLDNTAMPLILRGMAVKEARGKALGYFEDFGLSGFDKAWPYQLSGGMRQRAALLRTYLFASDIMLLDEPFGSLDAITRRRMHLWLTEICRRYNPAILFVTHDIEEAVFLSDRIYVLSERPATVKAEVIVDLPRPRTRQVISSAEFAGLQARIMDLL